MKIIFLIGNTYQVVNEDETSVFFQGTYMECLRYFYVKNIKLINKVK